MHKFLFIAAFSVISTVRLAVAEGEAPPGDTRPQPASETAAEEPRDSESRSVIHAVLWYVPDRILDVLDIFRLRLRVGPGAAAGVRATKLAQVYVGSYASVYAGLPGPRRRTLPRLPIGFETYNGIALSVVDATVSGPIGPDYSPTEFGISLHPLIFGFDLGFDPVELVDFVTGIFLIDIRDDDI